MGSTCPSRPQIFRPREQLMLRANSLKKAIRQIIEHTEKGSRSLNDEVTFLGKHWHSLSPQTVTDNPLCRTKPDAQGSLAAPCIREPAGEHSPSSLHSLLMEGLEGAESVPNWGRCRPVLGWGSAPWKGLGPAVTAPTPGAAWQKRAGGGPSGSATLWRGGPCGRRAGSRPWLRLSAERWRERLGSGGRGWEAGEPDVVGAVGEPWEHPHRGG